MSKQKEIVVFREVKVGEYVLRFWPSDNGWMCGITSEMMQALAEQPAPVQQEPTVSKGAYNRVRDDYNDLLKQSEQDAKDAKEWRAHVNRCKLAGIDLDYQITAPQPAQQEYASFAEWAHDYVQDNLHKLKPAQRTWVGLTNDEKHQLNDALNLHGRFPIIDAIESKIKEKNT